MLFILQYRFEFHNKSSCFKSGRVNFSISPFNLLMHIFPKVISVNLQEDQHDNFMRLCNWLENERDLYSISELYEQMISLAPSNSENYEVYPSHQYLKKKLQENYYEAIFFVEINGKSDVLCFCDTAGDIIRKYWGERKNNTDDSKSFVIAAAKILISELRSKTDFDVIHYPNSNDIADVENNKLWLPELLRVFMETLIKDPLNVSCFWIKVVAK